MKDSIVIKKGDKLNRKKEDRRTKGLWDVFFVMAAVIALMFLCGTSVFSRKKVQDTVPDRISFYSNEVMRVMDTPVTLAEYMLYTVDVKTPYDEAHGDTYWSEYSYNAQGEKETNETIVKEEIAESIRLVKVLCAAGKAYGVSLSEDEENILKAGADEYYNSLIKAGTDSSFLTVGIVNKYVREQYLSERVYHAILQRSVTDAPSKMPSEKEEELCDALMEEIADLLARYDGDWQYSVNINWDLLNEFRFSDSWATGYPEPDKEDLDDAVRHLLDQNKKKEGETE